MEDLRQNLRVVKERAILVAAIVKGNYEGDDLAELTALVESAGVVVVDRVQQKIRTIHSALYIGKGKAAQLAERVERHKADVIIFDNDLLPRQIRELEKVTDTRVLDRSELILDIFASRARTKQARLQVELAQLEYTSPRLTRMWSHLDSVAGAGGGTAAGAVGGIGTRGTGEKQLEIDRRLVSKRITELKRELDKIDKRKIREIHGRSSMFKVCLVGYTNAGKSTVLNSLTGAGAFVEDRLFATLDTRTRKWLLQKGVEVLLSDTVGFLKNLPHQLIASFRATLEEAVNADLFLHIIDVSNPMVSRQIESVNELLSEIGCSDKPSLQVFNKVDIVKQIEQIEMLQSIYPDAICISARTGLGLEELKQVVLARYRGNEVMVRICSSNTDGRLQSFLRRYGTINSERYSDNSVLLDVRLGRNHLVALRRLKPDVIEIID